jgi:hypothetical protein
MVAVESLIDGQQIWEEKIDGANCGISFSNDAELRLQSRGHFLTGGFREAQFNRFKSWSQRRVDTLFDLFGNRYICYGEWCYAKHTVFYDRLPHYFLEFDIFDKERQRFLSTAARRRLLDGSPIVSVPVLTTKRIGSEAQVRALITQSLYKSDDWLSGLRRSANRAGVAVEQVIRDTDPSRASEGLYLKVEDDDHVIGRYKFVRPDFLQAILDSGTHWASRPIVPNQLDPESPFFDEL